MFWHRAKKQETPDVAATLANADERLHEYEAQVNRMAEANDALEAELARIRADLDAARSAETRAQVAETEAAGWVEAFRRVGEAASYRLKKAPEESWPDYKRRVMDILSAGKDSDLMKVILDLLAFKEREGYRSWISAKNPAEAEVLRLSCAGFRQARATIRAALSMAGSRGLEEALHEEKDFSALELDDVRLASSRRGH